jgi:hypothetical protein
LRKGGDSVNMKEIGAYFEQRAQELEAERADIPTLKPGKTTRHYDERMGAYDRLITTCRQYAAKCAAQP